jgi:hypothetical protein
MQRFTRVALSVATTVVVALAFVLAVAAAGSASTKPTHFAGFPPGGVKASTPTTGRLLIRLSPTITTGSTWNVYSDGRVIWQKWTSSGDATVVPDGARRLDTGYVQQRLAPEGVQLLLSKILATGLFEQDLMLDLGRDHAWAHHQVRRGDRMVTVTGGPSPDPADPRDFTKATAAQMRSLAWIEKLVANPARWLPTTAWANRQIRAFVPARYWAGLDRDYPDISKLPSPAGKVLVRYKPLMRHGCQVLTTGKARELLQAFVEAGLSPSENHAFTIAFALAGRHHPSDLHMSPALPDNDRC